MGHNDCLQWLEPYAAARREPAIDHIVLLGYAVDTGHCRHADLMRTLERYYRKSFDNTYARVYERLP